MVALNIAVIGATGLVGQSIIELLEEREFPVGALFAFVSKENNEESIRFKGKRVSVKTVVEADWSQIDIAFLATSASETKQIAIQIAESGCIVIDSSGFFADSPHTPLVLPEINESVLSEYRQSNIVALPNGMVTQLLKTAFSLTTPENIVRLDVTSYLPASFYGKQNVQRLAGQSARLLNGQTVEGEQIAFNLMPAKTCLNSGIPEEDLVEQCRRIVNDERFSVSFNMVNVPVFYGLSQSVNITLQYPIDLERLNCHIKGETDVELITNNTNIFSLFKKQEAPGTLTISNMHYGSGIPELLQVWSATDNIRFLGALTAVKTAECLLKNYL